MAEFPSFPLWTDAYLADTKHLSTIEHGAYLLLLMCMWRSKGKLPNDDRLLARYSGLTPSQWKRIKPILWPFFDVEITSISQGRLTDELAFVKQRSIKSSNSAKARWLKSNNVDDANASSGQCLNDAPTPTPTPTPDVVNTTSNAGARKTDFETWWKAYPHKVGKGAARTAFEKAFKNHDTSLPELLGGLNGYIKTKPPDQNWCNPATWLNQERWKDEPDNQTSGNTASTRHPDNRSGAQIMFDASTELAAEYDAGIHCDENQSGFTADPGTKEMDIGKGEYSSRPLLPSKGR